MPVLARCKVLSTSDSHVVVLCGVRSCGGRLGEIADARTQWREFRWWPPSGFLLDRRTETYKQTTRSARQYRQQMRRVGRGELPRDRSPAEPRGTGRQSRSRTKVISSRGEFLLASRRSQAAPAVGKELGSSGLPIHRDKPERRVMCPACGQVNVITYHYLATIRALW